MVKYQQNTIYMHLNYKHLFNSYVNTIIYTHKHNLNLKRKGSTDKTLFCMHSTKKN